MNAICISSLYSDNRKSAIQNRKLAGDLAHRSHARLRWGCGTGAAAEESPSDRVSIVGRSSYVSPPVPRQFGWLCASLAT